MDLLASAPNHPNLNAGLSRVFSEYYMMFAAFEWVGDLFEMIKSFFQGILDFFSTKERYDF